MLPTFLNHKIEVTKGASRENRDNRKIGLWDTLIFGVQGDEKEVRNEIQKESLEITTESHRAVDPTSLKICFKEFFI